MAKEGCVRENCARFAFLRIVNSWHREKQQHSCHTAWIQQPWEIPMPNSAHLMLWVSKGRDFEERGHQTAWSESQQSAQRADDKQNLWVCIYHCGLQQLGFRCFPPFAATDLSQRQLTFASSWWKWEGEANICFLALLMHAGSVGKSTMAVSSQAKAQPPIISPQDNPLALLKVGQRLFLPSAHTRSSRRLELPASPPTELGTLLPLPCKETAGAFSGAWQPPYFCSAGPWLQASVLQEAACWLWRWHQACHGTRGHEPKPSSHRKPTKREG